MRSYLRENGREFRAVSSDCLIESDPAKKEFEFSKCSIFLQLRRGSHSRFQ